MVARASVPQHLAHGGARGHRVGGAERGLGGRLAGLERRRAASWAPTGRTARAAIESDEMPIPISAVASSGSAAASPQTPTGLPASLAGVAR